MHIEVLTRGLPGDRLPSLEECVKWLLQRRLRGVTVLWRLPTSIYSVIGEGQGIYWWRLASLAAGDWLPKSDHPWFWHSLKGLLLGLSGNLSGVLPSGGPLFFSIPKGAVPWWEKTDHRWSRENGNRVLSSSVIEMLSRLEAQSCGRVSCQAVIIKSHFASELSGQQFFLPCLEFLSSVFRLGFQAQVSSHPFVYRGRHSFLPMYFV